MAEILLEQYNSFFSKPRENYGEYPHKDYKCSEMETVVFTEEKIRKQISKLKNSSSTGPDGVISECFKYGGQFVLEALNDIFNQMSDEGYSPECTRENWIVSG